MGKGFSFYQVSVIVDTSVWSLSEDVLKALATISRGYRDEKTHLSYRMPRANMG